MNIDLTTLLPSAAAIAGAATGFVVVLRLRKAKPKRNAGPSLTGVMATVIGLCLIEYGRYRDDPRSRVAHERDGDPRPGR